MFNPGSLKTSFNSGEIAREAAGRIEIKSYFSGAELMSRVEPVPQGGFDLMPGTRMIGFARGILGEAASVAPAVAGGAVASGGTLCSGSLGAALSCCAVDFSGLTASVAMSVRFEYRPATSGAWIALPPFSLDAKTRVYRAACAPDAVMLIREFRLVRVDAGAAATITCGGTASLKHETADATDARPFSFHTSRANTFDLFLTEGNCDVFKEGVFQAALAVPYMAADIPALRHDQQKATMLIYHEDRPTQKILKLGDADWIIGDQLWSNVPKVDLGGSYTKTADKWRITVIGAQISTQWAQSSMELTIAGETTEAVSLDKIDLTAGDRTAIAALIQAKVDALAGVDAGISVTAEAVTVAGNYPFVIEFSGTDNIGERFEVSGRVYAPTAVAVNASRIQKADAGGEALFSPSRGYPRDGKITGAQRLVLGGFKAEPTAILASVLNSFFDLNTEIVTADGAVLIRPPASDGDVIERIVAARHIMIFTQDAEYFIVDRTLSKTSVPNLVQSSRNGCAENVPPIVADNAVFYVNRNNSMVYACQYNDVSGAYDSKPISLLASHLTRNIVDAAYQRPTQATDAGRYFLVRSDGLLVVGSVVQEQEITGFVRWPTDGAVIRVATDVKDRARLIVRRQCGNRQRLVLEEMDESLFLDACVEWQGAASATISGLGVHEGREVWAVADGHVLGPFTVTGGQITLDQPATQVTVGRWTPADAITLPASREVAPNTVLLRDGRITAVRLYVIDTTSIAIGANGQPPKAKSLYRAGQPADLPLAPYTGKLDAVALIGYQRGPQVRVTQLRPGKLKVRDLVYELKG